MLPGSMSCTSMPHDPSIIGFRGGWSHPVIACGSNRRRRANPNVKLNALKRACVVGGVPILVISGAQPRDRVMPVRRSGVTLDREGRAIGEPRVSEVSAWIIGSTPSSITEGRSMLLTISRREGTRPTIPGGRNRARHRLGPRSKLRQPHTQRVSGERRVCTCLKSVGSLTLEPADGPTPGATWLPPLATRDTLSARLVGMMGGEGARE